ncbi:Acylphosphatase-domain-containing protein [Obelidium mucronatum]|nr:Acylphosphatase-domain-containing protein [Obelidium mucronatum]
MKPAAKAPSITGSRKPCPITPGLSKKSSLVKSNASLKASLSSVQTGYKKKAPIMSSASTTDIVTLKFQVFGKVQGVYFRKYTAAKANELGLSGTVRNNKDALRTVQGIIQGPRSKIEEFQQWVSTVASPKSSISRCEFALVPNDEYSFTGPFSVDRQ